MRINLYSIQRCENLSSLAADLINRICLWRVIVIPGHHMQPVSGAYDPTGCADRCCWFCWHCRNGRAGVRQSCRDWLAWTATPLRDACRIWQSVTWPSGARRVCVQLLIDFALHGSPQRARNLYLIGGLSDEKNKRAYHVRTL